MTGQYKHIPPRFRNFVRLPMETETGRPRGAIPLVEKCEQVAAGPNFALGNPKLDLLGQESHVLTLFTLGGLNEFSEDQDVYIFYGIIEEFLKHQEKIIFTSSTRQMRAPPEILQWATVVLLLGVDNPMALLPKGGPLSVYSACIHL